jgi:hypothetical protein
MIHNKGNSPEFSQNKKEKNFYVSIHNLNRVFLKIMKKRMILLLGYEAEIRINVRRTKKTRPRQSIAKLETFSTNSTDWFWKQVYKNRIPRFVSQFVTME